MTTTRNSENQNTNSSVPVYMNDDDIESSESDNKYYYLNSGNNNEEIDDSFTWINIICFSFAGLPYHLMFGAVSVFGNKFLLDELGIEPKYTSVVLFP